MKSLFDVGEADSMRRRLEALDAGSRPLWGTMDAAAMAAHCAAALEAATGVRPLKRTLPARLLGGLFRGMMMADKPFGRNAPTHPDLRTPSGLDFAQERTRLGAALDHFLALGPSGVDGREHALVGAMTGEEWGRLQHKHMEHHLAQFGL